MTDKSLFRKYIKFLLKFVNMDCSIIFDNFDKYNFDSQNSQNSNDDINLDLSFHVESYTQLSQNIDTITSISQSPPMTPYSMSDVLLSSSPYDSDIEFKNNGSLGLSDIDKKIIKEKLVKRKMQEDEDEDKLLNNDNDNNDNITIELEEYKIILNKYKLNDNIFENNHKILKTILKIYKLTEEEIRCILLEKTKKTILSISTQKKYSRNKTRIKVEENLHKEIKNLSTTLEEVIKGTCLFYRETPIFSQYVSTLREILKKNNLD